MLLKGAFVFVDYGIGMPKEVLKNLKASNGKITPERDTNGEKGIGLGLKLCMSFAELNQCEIKFKSNRPTGTIVKISFNLQNTKTLS